MFYPHTATMSLVPVGGFNLPVAGEMEGSCSGFGPSSDIRESCHSRGKGVQLPGQSHPSHLAFTGSLSP